MSSEPPRSETHTDILELPATVEGRDVLFAHWRVEPDSLRSLVPDPLAIHFIDGDAWVSVLTQRIVGAGASGMSFPTVRGFAQLNLRTYVEFDGQVGVYFLSLLTGSRAGASLGRRLFRLPFRSGQVSMSSRGGRTTFRSQAVVDGSTRQFDARYRPMGDASMIDSESIIESLTERHVFFVPDGDVSGSGQPGSMIVGEISRQPWLIAECEAEIRTNTLLSANGVEPLSEPVLRHSPGYESTTESLRRVE